MSQTVQEDLERGKLEDGDQTQTQSARNLQPLRPLSFGDSSGPFFSIYSKAAEEEDNKMVERWQKDADGILIFTGLFSAAVAALLAVTVQDLRPNSQDTSAFYLGNIFEVLADPNATRASVPSPIPKPPPFSPPRYAIWVNSLWFLSLVMSVSCAMLATSLNQCSRRFIRLTQPARCSPEKRARRRAFFANGVDKMHIPWAVEGLPTLLHLSMFLFLGGLVIFLFNIDHAVFGSVMWWIGLFSIVYGLITVAPIVRHDSPYYAPLSRPAWFLYAILAYIPFKIRRSAHRGHIFTGQKWYRIFSLENRYHRWMLGGMEKAAEETLTGRLSEIDFRIFDWTLDALGDDDSLEAFFEAIPGFFSSKLVKDHNFESDFPEDILDKLWNSLLGFKNRTLSSNSVIDSVKNRRLIICRDFMDVIPYRFGFPLPPGFLDITPVSFEKLQAMARWRTHKDVIAADYARLRVAKGLADMQERGDDWIELATDVSGLAAKDLRDNVADAGNNMLLATMIQVARRAMPSPIPSHGWWFLQILPKFGIRYTLPGPLYSFCALWNELVQESRNQSTRPPTIQARVETLRSIRHLYIALHHGTDAAPAAFSEYTDDSDSVLDRPSLYPICDLASHRPDCTSHHHIPNSYAASTHTLASDPHNASPYQPSHGGSTIPQQTEQVNISLVPPSPPCPMTINEIGGTSHASGVTRQTNPIHSTPCPTDAPATGDGAAIMLQDITPATTLSHPLEGTTQQDVVPPCSEHDILSTTSTSSLEPTVVPLPASTPPVQNKSLASCETGTTLASNPSLPASFVGIPIPAYLPSRIPPLLDAETLLLNTTTPSHRTGDVTVPSLRALGLNTRSVCLVKAVLQLLMHSPPLWDLIRELSDLKERRRREGDPETGGRATPLVDATAIFYEILDEEEKVPPRTQRLPQWVTGRKPRKDEKRRKEHNTVPTSFMYDAIDEKRQLRSLLDGKHQDVEVFLGLFLAVLDEELVGLYACIGMDKPASAPTVEELDEEARSTEGQTKMGKQDFTTGLVESPILRVFGGRSISTVCVPNKPSAVTVEDWRLLQLNIKPDSVHTIQDALAHISQPRPVQVDQSWSSEASQQVLLETLPPVLVLHLERFSHEASASGIVKISKPILFAPELDIPHEIMAPVLRKSVEAARYKLCGVLYHHDMSAGSGGFSVDVLHPNRSSGSAEAWLRIDDEAVSALRDEEVFGDRNDDWVDDRCVYMLFYSRIASIQT